MPVNVRAYLPIRESLQKSFFREWETKSKPILRNLRKTVRNGTVDEIMNAVDDIDMSVVLTRRLKNDIRFYTEATVLFGVSRIITPSRSVYTKSNEGRDFVDMGVDQVQILVAAADTVLKSRLKLFVQKEAQRQLNVQKVGDLRLTKDFSLALGEIVGKSGENMLGMTSALHTTRMANYGFTVEARLRDITTYEITAVLDDRTSGVCKILDGKTFQVADGARTVEQQLAVTDVDVLKSIAPWPKQDALSLKNLAGMTGQELVAANLHLPPYHPYCRTIITRAANQIAQPIEPDNRIDSPLPLPRLTPQRIRPQNAAQALGLPNITPSIIEAVEAGLREGLTDLEMMTAIGISIETLRQAKKALDAIDDQENLL